MTAQQSFTPARAAGLARLAAFLPNAGRVYQSQRNTDFGPADQSNVSTLSPFIRHRLITEMEVLTATLDRHSASAADKFIAEVVWRTYFKGHLETRPEIWRRYRAELAELATQVTGKGGLAKAYRQAVDGKTGIACFNAWVEELIATGYLHNHTRMWFASIWIFTLKLPWQLGADFTYRHFLDGDPASNTLSWRWVAGLHTKGKTYLARPDNIREHTNGRFTPTGLAREAPPLDEPPLGPANRLSAISEAPKAGRAALLLTAEDLNPETLDLGTTDIGAIGLAHAEDIRSPLPVPANVLAFSTGALQDTADRATTHVGQAAEILPSLTDTTLRDLARRARATRIIVPYVPVGPTAEALAKAETILARDGITIERIRRAYDTTAWPHATRGFFAMKEKIPDLLDLIAAGSGAFSAEVDTGSAQENATKQKTSAQGRLF
ncbi:MAG: hypothetical protein RL291_2142 [Pseudomonadota bacterium]